VLALVFGLRIARTELVGGVLFAIPLHSLRFRERRLAICGSKGM